MSMNQEYRKELKELRRGGAAIYREAKRHAKDCDRQIHKLRMAANRSGKTANKMLARINKRIAILEGRLS